MRQPVRGGIGSSAAGTASAMRSTAPGGLSVYCATHSTKRRRLSVMGGASRISERSRSFASGRSGSGVPSHTTPSVARPDSGTTT
jgi:hypothetical protein